MIEFLLLLPFWALAHVRKRRWPGALRAAAILGLLFVIGEGYRLAQHRGIVERRGALDDRYRTPYLVFTPPKSATRGAVLLLHGWHCNAGMMTSMARMLARNGLQVHVPDMPGNGRSPVALEAPCGCMTDAHAEWARAGESIVKRLLDVEGLTGTPIVLVGHSRGGTIASRIDLPGQNVAARVSLEGKPPLPGSRELFIATLGFRPELPVVAAPPRETETAPARNVTMSISHMALIRDEEVNQEVLTWISRALGKRLGNDGRPLYWPSVGLAMIFGLFVLVTSAVGIDVAGTRMPVQLPQPKLHIRAPAVGILSGALIAGLVVPHLPDVNRALAGLAMERQLLPVYVALAAAVGWVFLLATRRPAFSWRGITGGGAWGVAAWLLMTLTVGRYVDSHIVEMSPTWERLPRSMAIAGAFLPMHALLRAVVPMFERAPWVRPVVLFAVWVALLAVWAYRHPAAPRHEELELLPVLGMGIIFAHLIERRTGSLTSGSAFMALLVGGYLAVAFPVIGG